MKANELRIGNLLQDVFNLNVLKVASITAKTITVTPSATKWGVEPIPLTEEWLLRFGFEDSEIALKLGCSLQIRLNTGHAALWSSDGCTESHNIITDCKYVHQLQNLYFALTGEELEVKL